MLLPPYPPPSQFDWNANHVTMPSVNMSHLFKASLFLFLFPSLTPPCHASPSRLLYAPIRALCLGVGCQTHPSGHGEATGRLASDSQRCVPGTFDAVDAQRLQVCRSAMAPRESNCGELLWLLATSTLPTCPAKDGRPASFCSEQRSADFHAAVPAPPRYHFAARARPGILHEEAALTCPMACF